MLTLYIHSKSSNARKVVALTDYLGLDYLHHDVALEQGEQHDKRYRTVNPMGKVPAMDHDGFVLVESAAILAYLARAFDHADLVGSPQRTDEARVQQWLCWESAHLAPTVSTIFFRRVLEPMLGMSDGSDTLAVSEALQRLRGMLAVINEELRYRSYLAFDALSVADFAAGNSLVDANRMDFELRHFPRVYDWLARLEDANVIAGEA